MRPPDGRAQRREPEGQPSLLDGLPEPLEVGALYRGVGPVNGKWESEEVRIVGVNDKGYVTEGPRQVATIIVYGCERFWRKVQD